MAFSFVRSRGRTATVASQRQPVVLVASFRSRRRVGLLHPSAPPALSYQGDPKEYGVRDRKTDICGSLPWSPVDLTVSPLVGGNLWTLSGSARDRRMTGDRISILVNMEDGLSFELRHGPPVSGCASLAALQRDLGLGRVTRCKGESYARPHVGRPDRRSPGFS